VSEINVNGQVTGNVQSGRHAQATFIHNENTAPADSAASPEVRRLRTAVHELREQIRALAEAAPDQLDPEDARLAAGVLDEVAAAGDTAVPEPGRLRRAVATLTGALTSAAGLAQAVEALREAAKPLF
jgi:hypothetical protein